MNIIRSIKWFIGSRFSFDYRWNHPKIQNLLKAEIEKIGTYPIFIDGRIDMDGWAFSHAWCGFELSSYDQRIFVCGYKIEELQGIWESDRIGKSIIKSMNQRSPWTEKLKDHSWEEFK